LVLRNEGSDNTKVITPGYGYNEAQYKKKKNGKIKKVKEATEF
jgi:hypothetical protein